jgi:tetratricopeptide (TPR) repeat protein
VLARNRIGRGPVAAVLIYVGVLFPALGFSNVYAFRYSFVTDHYQYHAMPALVALAAAVAIIGANRVTEVWRAIGCGAAAALLAILGILAYRQAMLYQDREILYRDVIAKNPDSWVAYGNIGTLLWHKGREAEAIAAYREAVRSNPVESFGHLRLGGALAETAPPGEAGSKQLDEAIEHLMQVLRRNPDDIDALNRMMRAQIMKNRPDRAKIFFDRALTVNRPRALYAMGDALNGVGDWKGAQAYLEESLRLDSLRAESHLALGNSLAKQGQEERAAEHYKQVTELTPLSFQGWNNLGAMLINLGRVEEALPCVRRALELKPEDPTANANLKEALEKLGQSGSPAAEATK